jgi:hypothetical protein
MTRHSVETMKKTVCAAALLATSAVAQEVKAQQAEAFWDNGTIYPALYYFRETGPNANTGVRTTYPTRKIEQGHPAGFAYALDPRMHILTMQFNDGSREQFRLDRYDPQRDIMFRTGIGQSALNGPGPWFGCRSGGIPPLIAQYVCAGAQQGKAQ